MAESELPYGLNTALCALDNLEKLVDRLPQRSITDYLNLEMGSEAEELERLIGAAKVALKIRRQDYIDAASLMERYGVKHLTLDPFEGRR